MIGGERERERETEKGRGSDMGENMVRGVLNGREVFDKKRMS